MKKIVFVLATMWIALFSSCEQNPKEISPSQIKFTNGTLAELVEIDTLPTMLSYEAPENGTTHIFRMTVNMILKKETPCLQKHNQKNISFDGGNIALNLLDESGTKLIEMSILKEDKAKVKQLLQGQSGDTLRVSFMATTENAEEAPKWFKSASSFAAGKACNVYPYVLNFSGNIDKYPVKMTLQVNPGKTIRGAYYYVSRGPKALLFLKGYVDEKNEVGMAEFNSKGMMVGSHDLAFKNGNIEGTFMTIMAGTMTPLKYFDAKLTPDTEMEAIDFWSKANFDDCFEVWANPNYDEDENKEYED